VGNHVRVQGYVDSGIGPSGPVPVSARHFSDTSPESSARMRDDFEATSSAIWCWAKSRRAMRRSRRDVAREGGASGSAQEPRDLADTVAPWAAVGRWCGYASTWPTQGLKAAMPRFDPWKP